LNISTKGEPNYVQIVSRFIRARVVPGAFRANAGNDRTATTTTIASHPSDVTLAAQRSTTWVLVIAAPAPRKTSGQLRRGRKSNRYDQLWFGEGEREIENAALASRSSFPASPSAREVMMSIKSPSKIACLFTLMSFVTAPVCVGDKEDKEKLDRLWARLEDMKPEMITLEKQAQSLRDAINRAGGEQCGLIRQIIRNTSAIRRAQLTISTNSKDASTQIASIGEQITEANERLERLSEQFAALKKLIEDVPKQPAFAQITPGDPEQLFAVAYSDYSHGNYALALSEFQQYIETYPDSEMADNAEYWIGEILYAQKKYQDAADALIRVFGINPKGEWLLLGDSFSTSNMSTKLLKVHRQRLKPAQDETPTPA
jgi:TolA-binding protein